MFLLSQLLERPETDGEREFTVTAGVSYRMEVRTPARCPRQESVFTASVPTVLRPLTADRTKEKKLLSGGNLILYYYAKEKECFLKARFEVTCLCRRRRAG